MDILTFWELTPHEFSLVVEANAEKQKHDAEEKISIAYMTAYWTAQWSFGKKKPDSLQKILGHTKAPKHKMTDEEMLERVKLLHKALGGE